MTMIVNVRQTHRTVNNIPIINPTVPIVSYKPAGVTGYLVEIIWYQLKVKQTPCSVYTLYLSHMFKAVTNDYRFIFDYFLTYRLIIHKMSEPTVQNIKHSVY